VQVIDEMTYDVLMGTLNPTHSLRLAPPSLIYCKSVYQIQLCMFLWQKRLPLNCGSSTT